MAKMEGYKIRRPQFIIFTDKDGTIDLEDKQLNNIFNLINSMGGMVIPVTGRTVGDIESDLKKRKIKVPEIVVGDNGSNIYHTKSDEFLVQRVLKHEKVLAVVEHFLEQGGNPDYIRYTNGKNVFGSKTKEVKEYYKNSKMAVLKDDIVEALKNAEDVTKVTLAGSKEQMEENAEFVQTLDFWSDMIPTKFPKRDYKNYILDISQKDINKGEAVKAIVSKLKPKFGYMCVGNGYNDMSMFKVAINDGMIAGVMGNASSELIGEIKRYCYEMDKGRVMVIPAEKNLANKYLLKMAKLFQCRIKEKQRKSKRLPNVQRVQIKPVAQSKYKNRVNQQRNNRNR